MKHEKVYITRVLRMIIHPKWKSAGDKTRTLTTGSQTRKEGRTKLRREDELMMSFRDWRELGEDKSVWFASFKNG